MGWRLRFDLGTSSLGKLELAVQHALVPSARVQALVAVWSGSQSLSIEAGESAGVRLLGLGKEIKSNFGWSQKECRVSRLAYGSLVACSCEISYCTSDYMLIELY
jgi:hypothetical protein